MPHTQYLRGQTRPTEVPFVTALNDGNTTIVFDPGDLVGMDATSHLVRRFLASDTAGTGATSGMNQFLGVCAQKLVTGSLRVYGNPVDRVIRVDTSGVFEFDIASSESLYVGQPVTVSSVATAGSPVVTAGDASIMIGRAVKAKAANVGARAQVEIYSRAIPSATPISNATNA